MERQFSSVSPQKLYIGPYAEPFRSKWTQGNIHLKLEHLNMFNIKSRSRDSSVA